MALILAVDIGTSSMKMGLFRREDAGSGGESGLTAVRQCSRDYTVNTYNNGLFNDIEQEKWITAFIDGCKELEGFLPEVDVLSLSGTTPGFTPMDANGEALCPAILMFDQRAKREAGRIIDDVGLHRLLEITANYPVPGGCTLPSILWLKENHPEIFSKTAVFGHSNTYFAYWLTGRAALDPSSASLTLLYNTAANDFTWNGDIASHFGIRVDMLPELMPSHGSTGRVKQAPAKRLGLTREPAVVIGGNDATLAAYAAGIVNPGDIVNVNGTCEITLICLPRCLPSRNYNTRVHAVPGRWLTNHVLNAGGKAIEWFRNLFCSEMTDDEFYTAFIPQAVDEWTEKESGMEYVPYLMGSRYSVDPLTAGFSGFTLASTRREMFAALIKGLYTYQRKHLEEISRSIPLNDTIILTGGAVTDNMIKAKRRWVRDCRYTRKEQSSLLGAALLGSEYLTARESSS